MASHFDTELFTKQHEKWFLRCIDACVDACRRYFPDVPETLIRLEAESAIIRNVRYCELYEPEEFPERFFLVTVCSHCCRFCRKWLGENGALPAVSVNANQGISSLPDETWQLCLLHHDVLGALCDNPSFESSYLASEPFDFELVRREEIDEFLKSLPTDRHRYILRRLIEGAEIGRICGELGVISSALHYNISRIRRCAIHAFHATNSASLSFILSFLQ